MTKKTVSSLNEIPAVKEYLIRIGAEPRSLLTAVVREMHGKYWQDIAVIRFERDGTVSAPDAYMPSESEMTRITAQFDEFQFPFHQTVTGLTNLPKQLAEADQENIFEFRDATGNIMMLQLRIDREGDKNYVPYTYWSDGQWRATEPEGELPLWGIDQLKDHTTVFIHEGAKAARAMRRMVEAKTKKEKDRLAMHPWGDELAGAAHIGWIGGALSPARTDWSVLMQLGVKRAYIVSDNDNPGRAAVPAISFKLRCDTFHVQFTDEWPNGFDLADDFPEKMFKEIDGMKHFVGPSFRSCLHPATWATNLIPNPKGKPTVALRENFKTMWSYVEEADLWVCNQMPEIVRTEAIANKVFAPFSHANETTRLLLKSYQGRASKICYRPDIDGRVVTDRSTSAINLHVPSQIKAVSGDAGPWLEFLAYMFPTKKEREHVMRWCATLIARPKMRMEFGLLLVSEAQGIGKTTLGAEILGKLVGDHNVGYPSEKTITDGTFTDWIAQKRLIVVNEIYSGHSWKAYNTLKTYITDKDVTVNAKYQKPYMIDNWAHMIACSNSMRALRMEEDDRRWFYPELTEERWPAEKFREFYNWLQAGGLSIIAHWADKHRKYVKKGERAPMTDRKRDMIAGSRSEAQVEVAALAEAAERKETPLVLSMKEIEMWVRGQVQGRVFDTPYDLRKTMKDAGMKPSRGRVFVRGRLQYVMANSAAHSLISAAEDQGAVIRDTVKKPEEVMEGEM